jgi:signal transduction histidine kinase
MNQILPFTLRPAVSSPIWNRIKCLFTSTGQLADADFNARSDLVHKQDGTGRGNGKIARFSSITRDFTECRRAEDRLKALHDINLAVTSSLELSAILQILLEKIDVLLPDAAAHIRLINKATGEIEPIACHNMDEAKWKAGVEAIQHPIHRSIVQSQRPVILRNLQHNERFSCTDFCREQGLVSYIGLPLTVQGEGIGVLSLFTREEHKFTGEEIAFAETLAKQASVAIHNSQLYEQSKKLSQDLIVNERQIRALVSGLIYAQDDEAKRIARSLHDESGQLLATVYIALDEMAKGMTPTAKEPLEKVKGLLDQIEEGLRNLSHELHPTILDHLGLLPSFDFLAQQISKRAGIEVTIDGATNRRLSPLVELTLYRVVQEALNNAAKHSHASNVRIRLFEEDGRIQCSIQDNGIGFDPKTVSGWPGRKGSGLGLAGMRERVDALCGTFEILSAPGKGTKLFVAVPQEKIVEEVQQIMQHIEPHRHENMTRGSL